MLNNPDIQPNTIINHWVTGILLFDFIHKHVPGATHGPDGLSQCPAQPDDKPNPPDDFEDWIDKSYGFMHMINPHSVCYDTGQVLLLYTLTSSRDQELPSPPSIIHSAANEEPVHIFSNELATPLNFTPLSIDTDTNFIPQTLEVQAANSHLNLIVHILQCASCLDQIIEVVPPYQLCTLLLHSCQQPIVME